MNLVSMSNFLSGLLGAAVVAAVSFFMLNSKVAELELELEHRPPIVVVDFVELAKNYPSNVTDRETEQIMRNTHNTIAKLIQSGYVVLDKSEIIGAPTDIYIPSDLILKSE